MPTDLGTEILHIDLVCNYIIEVSILQLDECIFHCIVPTYGQIDVMLSQMVAHVTIVTAYGNGKVWNVDIFIIKEVWDNFCIGSPKYRGPGTQTKDKEDWICPYLQLKQYHCRLDIQLQSYLVKVNVILYNKITRNKKGYQSMLQIWLHHLLLMIRNNWYQL